MGIRIHTVQVISALAIAMLPIGTAAAAGAVIAPESHQQTNTPAPTAGWQTPARMHGTFPFIKERGTLRMTEEGMEFRAENGRSYDWPLLNIDTFSIGPHRLVLQTYTNRSLHRPGEQRYRFDLIRAVPPAVAASLARGVARPSRNEVPDTESTVIASLPVHHRRPTGGTNGVLRFRKGGIDYVASSPGDSRSWRWADLQTLSDPDPYHLFVFGYRDTYTFDLKEPLPRVLFHRATDEIYAQAVSTPVDGEEMPVPKQPDGSETRK